MAYLGSEGWFVQRLKEKGIFYHPVEKRKIETYRGSALRRLYWKYVEGQEEKAD